MLANHFEVSLRGAEKLTEHEAKFIVQQHGPEIEFLTVDGLSIPRVETCNAQVFKGPNVFPQSIAACVCKNYMVMPGQEPEKLTKTSATRRTVGSRNYIPND